MNCPPEIAGILLEILATGLLRIRALGWDHNAKRCAIEADHLHNLPSLIKEYGYERLGSYWEVERMSYRQQSLREDIKQFEPLWDRLAAAMNRQERSFAATGSLEQD